MEWAGHTSLGTPKFQTWPKPAPNPTKSLAIPPLIGVGWGRSSFKLDNVHVVCKFIVAFFLSCINWLVTGNIFGHC